MITSTPKYAELAQGIEQRLTQGHLRVGERLPPIRTLANRHGVSGATMNRSIQLLVKKGLLSSRPGGGTYVQRLPSSNTPSSAKVKEGVIGYVLAQHAGMGKFDPDLLAGIQSLFKAYDKRVEFEQFTYPFDPADASRLLGRDWHGVVLTGNVQDHHVRAIRDTKLPFVVSGNVPVHERCDRVRFDVESSYRSLFDRLLTRGYRRIGVVIGRIDYAGNKLLAQTCVDVHRTRGIPFDPQQIETDDRDTGEGSMDRLIARMGKPDAIVSQGNPLPDVIRSLRAHGLEPRRNVVLAGMWNSSESSPIRLNIRLELPNTAWHQATVQTLMERMRRGMDEQPVEVLLPVIQTLDGELPDPELIRAAAATT
jgi:DNA-binding LacI/PurR family transcriptional regulator